MLAVEHLARVGFEFLARDIFRAADPDATREDLERHDAVRERLLHPVSPRIGSAGINWVVEVTWPDRVPGLVTWAGNQTLAKIVRKMQTALESSRARNLYELTAPLKGASGLDQQSAPTALEAGFSPATQGMAVVSRPGLELLAVVGLETVPLLSFGPRECGYLWRGRVHRFPVERRDGYYHRWGEVTDDGLPWERDDVPPSLRAYT